MDRKWNVVGIEKEDYMNKNLLILVTVVLSQFSWAQDVPEKVQTCIACHGANGVSVAPLWPNLAGQKFDYLEKQLLAFKSGERKDPMMNPLSENLNEADIKEIAKYFSNLK